MKNCRPLLLKSLAIIKPNFHAFTARFHEKLTTSNVHMGYPTATQFNEKSYTLYCVLERIVKHLDSLSSIAPFLSHHLECLKYKKIKQPDILILCDAFYTTLKEHLGQLFTEKYQTAWRKFLAFFTNFANATLFNVTNVVSLEQRMAQKHGS
jgi:hypothetical protein